MYCTGKAKCLDDAYFLDALEVVFLDVFLDEEAIEGGSGLMLGTFFCS